MDGSNLCLLGSVCCFLYCIFSVQSYGGVDVKLGLTFDGGLMDVDPSMFPTIEVIETPGRNSLANIIGDMMATNNVKIVATASPLPFTETDECFFVVGFLSPLESITATKPFPNRKECEKNNLVPTIGVADEILGYPQCIKYADLKSIDFTKLIGEHGRTHCGMYRLVGMLDPLREVQDETNFCNNYLTFDINFNCSIQTVTEPTCDLLPMGTDDDDITLLYMNHMRTEAVYGQPRRFKHAMQMFRQREMSPEWNEEYEKDYDVVGKYGKMFTKIMRAYIKGLPKESYIDDCSSEIENGAKEWVKSQLNEFQGLNGENTWGDANEDSVINYRQLLTLIKGYVQEMKDDSQLSNIAERLRAELSSLGYTSAGELTGVRAMNATINEMISLVHNHKQEIAKKYVAKEVCGVANTLERFKQMSAQTQYQYMDLAGKEVKEMIAKFSDTTSSLAVKLMFFYPEFYDTCFENMLMHLHDALKQDIQSVRFDWMNDESFQQRLNDYRMNKTGFPFNEGIYAKLLHGCGKRNACIRKMKSMCRQQDQSFTGNGETVETLKEDVCKMRRMKEVVSKHAKRISDNNMMQMGTMQKDPFDAVCNGNDKMTTRKQMPLTKMEKGIVKRGYLDLENKMVAWQSIARCTCDHCGKHPVKGGGESDDIAYADDEDTSDSHGERDPSHYPNGEYPEDDGTRSDHEDDGDTTEGDDVGEPEHQGDT